MAITSAGRSAAILLSLCGASLSGCGATNPNAPVDPGTVIVLVRDDAGSALANVPVSVTEPNNVGSFFMVGKDTNAVGMATFPYVPAGQRPVTVTPPPRYMPSADGPTQNANVIVNQTTTVTFTLVHQAP
jgi:hypothetical protein